MLPMLDCKKAVHTKNCWILKRLDVGVLGWRVHLCQDLFWESLWKLVKINGASSGLNSLLLSLSKLRDVAIHAVVHNCDLGSHVGVFC
jgi:hypothetical protein